jgi:hypothetical protein
MFNEFLTQDTSEECYSACVRHDAGATTVSKFTKLRVRCGLPAKFRGKFSGDSEIRRFDLVNQARRFVGVNIHWMGDGAGDSAANAADSAQVSTMS